MKINEISLVKSLASLKVTFYKSEIEILDEIIDEFATEYGESTEKTEQRIREFMEDGIDENPSVQEFKKDIVNNLGNDLIKKVISREEVLDMIFLFHRKEEAFSSFLEDVEKTLSDKYQEVLKQNRKDHLVREQVNSQEFFKKYQKDNNLSGEEFKSYIFSVGFTDENTRFLVMVFNFFISKVNYKKLTHNQNVRLFIPSLQLEGVTSENGLYDIEEVNPIEHLSVYLNPNVNFGDIRVFNKIEESNVFIYPNFWSLDIEGDDFQNQIHVTDLSLKLLDNNKTESCILAIEDDFLQSKDSLSFRKRIVESNYLQSIVFFPERYSNSTATSFSLIVLSRKNIAEEVRVVDLNNFADLSDIKSSLNISFEDFKTIYENNKSDSGVKSFGKAKATKVGKPLSLGVTSAAMMKSNLFEKKLFSNERKIGIDQITHQSEAGKFLLNYGSLKYNKSRNLEQYPIVPLSNILELVEREPKLSSDELVIDYEETEHSISYYMNKNSAKNLDNEAIYLLSESYLYINLISFKLAPKLYEPSEKPFYIGPKYFPFSIKKDLEINKLYLIEALKEINYKVFISEVVELDEFDLNKLVDAFYDIKIILPPIEVQNKILISKQVNIISLADEKINKYRNQNDDLEEKTYNVSALEHALNGAFNEMNSNIKRIYEIIDKHPEIKGLKKLDRSNLTLEDSAHLLIKDYKRINSVLSSFYKENLFEVDLEKLDISKFVREFNIEEYTENAEVVKVDNLSGTGGRYILGDEGKIKIALDNLFENAVQHAFNQQSPNKFKIELNILKGKTILSAYNTGKPFSKNMTLKKFTSRKISTKKSIFSGSGGFLIKRIMDGHKGEIKLNTKKDGEFVTRIDLFFDTINEKSEIIKNIDIKDE